jgi:hypothetical protein
MYLTHLSAFWLSVEDEWYKMVTVVLTSAQVLCRKLIVKGTVSRDFLLLVFFTNQFPPSPRVFQIFSKKIRGDMRKPRCTTSINDTGCKFATGINDTDGKITAGINNTAHMV